MHGNVQKFKSSICVHLIVVPYMYMVDKVYQLYTVYIEFMFEQPQMTDKTSQRGSKKNFSVVIASLLLSHHNLPLY